MNYKVGTIAPFRRNAKKLIKKYPSLKQELAELGNRLSSNPTAGTPLGNNCYKIRLAVASKGKGNFQCIRFLSWPIIFVKTKCPAHRPGLGRYLIIFP
jgi:hypothetical protein